jgi:hypothetical protein
MLNRRIERLEKRFGIRQYCPGCARQGPVTLTYRRDFASKKCELISGEEPAPCSLCGERPPVDRIEEVVIHNREQAIAFFQRSAESPC